MFIQDVSNITMRQAKTLLVLLATFLLSPASYGDDSEPARQSALADFLQKVDTSERALRTKPCAPPATRFGQLPRFLPLERDTLAKVGRIEELPQASPPAPQETIRQVYAVKRWELDAAGSNSVSNLSTPDKDEGPPWKSGRESDVDRVPETDPRLEATQQFGTALTDNASMVGAGLAVRQMDLHGAFETAGLPESQYQPNRLGADHRAPYAGASTRFNKQWAADNLAHKTLYFEDLRLERHGESHRDIVQAPLSFLRFMGDAVAAPFRVICVPPHKCFYVQCEGRPGAPRD